MSSTCFGNNQGGAFSETLPKEMWQTAYVLPGVVADQVYVGGGHGMWGIALGPLTGKLLAGSIVGEPDPVLTHFDPLR